MAFTGPGCTDKPSVIGQIGTLLTGGDSRSPNAGEMGRTGRPGDASPPSQFCQKRGEDGAAKGAKGDCVERLGSMGGVKETVDGNVVMGLKEGDDGSGENFRGNEES